MLLMLMTLVQSQMMQWRGANHCQARCSGRGSNFAPRQRPETLLYLMQ